MFLSSIWELSGTFFFFLTFWLLNDDAIPILPYDWQRVLRDSYDMVQGLHHSYDMTNVITNLLNCLERMIKPCQSPIPRDSSLHPAECKLRQPDIGNCETFQGI